MNSYGPNVLQDSAGRSWSADSRRIEGELATAATAIQARNNNKFKAIGNENKYFLTISRRQLGPNDRCEPSEWFH